MLVRAARDGSAGPCGGTSGAEGLERQRLACILLRLNLALAVRISGPPRPVTLRSKVGKGLRGAGAWVGTPVKKVWGGNPSIEGFGVEPQ